MYIIYDFSQSLANKTPILNLSKSSWISKII